MNEKRFYIRIGSEEHPMIIVDDGNYWEWVLSIAVTLVFLAMFTK